MNLFPQYVEVKFFNRELINKLELYDVFINKKDWFYKTPGALAFDLYAIVEEPVIIYPFHSTKIPMGLALQLWNDDTLFGLIISIRSSVSLKGLSLTNGVGIIDADFQGEIHCSVENNNRNNYYTIEPGERIAQAMIVPTIQFNENSMKIVEEFSRPTIRNSSGFGTTGKF